MKKNPCYTNHQVKTIRWIYIVALLLWIISITFLKMIPTSDLVEAVILYIPVIVFLISYMSAPNVTHQVENFMFQADLLTLGLLVALPLIQWSQIGSSKNQTTFIKLATIAIILSMLTLIDVWVSHEYLYIVKHLKSIVETIVIVILIYGLYQFFIKQENKNVQISS